MIQSYQETPVLLASNSSPLTFSTDCIKTRCANCYGFLQHSQGSPLYKILNGGNYDVTFNANVTSATAGVVALGIKANGELLSGTEMDYTVATANAYNSVSSNRLVRVCGNSSTTITVGSLPTSGATATQIPTIKNASLVIKRIGN